METSLSATALLLIAANGTALLMTCLIALRVLWLSFRTKGLPERLIGSALTSLTLFTIPLMGLSGLGRVSVGEMKLGLLAGGFISLWLGVSCLLTFTWKTFRPTHKWAHVLTVVASLGTSLLLLRFMHIFITSPPETHSAEAAGAQMILLRLPFLVCWIWTGVEGFAHYRMAKRRVALGLTTPAIANRFLLWSCVGFFQITSQLTTLVLQSQGTLLLNSPAGASLLTISALFVSILMLLAFAPPRSYSAWVERRFSMELA